MTQRFHLPSWFGALALLALVMSVVDARPLSAEPATQTCSTDQLNAAVDAAAAELRTFSAEAQPKLKQQLAALRDKYKWPEDSYEDRALEHLQDGKLSMLDTQANELLTRIDSLGRPEENPGADTCTSVNEVKAAVSELLSVMREKANYISVKVSAELGAAPAPPAASPQTTVAAAPAVAPAPTPAPAPAPAEAAKSSPPATPQAAPKAPDASSVVSTVATAKGQAPATAPAPPPQVSTPAPAMAPATAPPPQQKLAKADPAPAKPQPQAPVLPPPQAKAPVTPPPLPPPTAPQAQPPWQTSPSANQAAVEPDPYPSAGGTYSARAGEEFPAGSEPYGPPPTEDAAANGYTIDEIRDATKGFFGTISTSLASVIEHAFQKSGRPTAYILGNEGGGAFLAGLRYGEGTMYLRNGGTQKVYWHGPSIGSDVGADGSRTLFLVYRLNSPDDLYRQFTGIDGTAFLVGGVGLTYLKGGSVVMAPIRSGIGLRFGASLGYLRFTSHKTWNPF